VTSPNPVPAPAEWPDATTAVLARRKLHPDSDPATLSVFADDQWNLTPGLFEAHATTTRLNLRTVPAPFRDPVKHYLWQMINGVPAARQRGHLRIPPSATALPTRPSPNTKQQQPPPDQQSEKLSKIVDPPVVPVSVGAGAGVGAGISAVVALTA
jgi:hypothetical protein